MGPLRSLVLFFHLALCVSGKRYVKAWNEVLTSDLFCQGTNGCFNAYVPSSPVCFCLTGEIALLWLLVAPLVANRDRWKLSARRSQENQTARVLLLMHLLFPIWHSCWLCWNPSPYYEEFQLGSRRTLPPWYNPRLNAGHWKHQFLQRWLWALSYVGKRQTLRSIHSDTL